jgi:transcription antitermination factor NusG
MSFGNNPGWFALTVRPNHEHTASRGLSNQGLETYLPVYRARKHWSDRVRECDAVLFPGYVFCRFGLREKLRVLQAPGVRSIVGSGKEPVRVEDDEISAVRAVLSSGRAVAPWPYVRIGQSVIIEHGPLASLRGVILRTKGSWRVVVSVEALGSSISVEVDGGVLSLDGNGSPHGNQATSLLQRM